jgi:hypothetical protein
VCRCRSTQHAGNWPGRHKEVTVSKEHYVVLPDTICALLLLVARAPQVEGLYLVSPKVVQIAKELLEAQSIQWDAPIEQIRDLLEVLQ